MSSNPPASAATEPRSRVYGTPEHAAREALNESNIASDDFVSAFAADVAQVVIDGLRKRGFAVTREPRCECGWNGSANHYHDMRMGRANG